MLTIEEFWQAILPAEGIYVSAAVINGKMIQHFHDTTESLYNAITKYDDRKCNAYFAVASYKEKSSREGENTRAFKSIAADIDVGPEKPYPDAQQAVSALATFITQFHLPLPLIVSSGGGIHAYWVLEQEVTPAEWRPVALALKAAAQFSKFGLDPAVTGDLSRILRAPGTHNYKHNPPTEVRVLSKKFTPVAIATLASLFSAFMGAPSRSLAVNNALEVKKDYPPADPLPIVRHCPQVTWAVQHQDQVVEPLWYGLMGIAAFSIDPETVAIHWSQQHPDFSEQATLSKLYQWKSKTDGPPTCQYFEQIEPKWCKTCKFKDKITSPIQLGARAEPIKPEDAPTDIPQELIALPFSYVRTKEGIKQVIDGVELTASPYDMYPQSWGEDIDGNHLVFFKFKNYNSEWRRLRLTYDNISAGGKDLLKMCGTQGMVIPQGDLPRFNTMLRNYLKHLETTVKRVAVFDQFGWVDGNTKFVIGNRQLGKDTDEKATLGIRAIDFQGAFEPKGDAAAWSQVISRFYAAPEMEPLAFMLCIGFAAPLWKFTHTNSFVISYVGATGVGKTLTQKVLQSIYGNPKDLHIPFHTTMNAIWERVGTMRNLPITLDETTMMDETNTRSFVYSASSDKTKLRLNKGGALRPAVNWSTLLVVSTNRHFLERLTSDSYQDVAITARIAEFVVDRTPFIKTNPDLAKKVHDFVHENYGTVGRIWLQHLAGMGEDYIKERMSVAREDIIKEYGWGASAEERFYVTLAATVRAAMEEAEKIGLVSFDWHRALTWAINYLRSSTQMEDQEVISQETGERVPANPLANAVSRIEQRKGIDLLTKYLSECAAMNTVIFRSRDANSPLTWDMNSNPRGEIYVRYELLDVSPGTNAYQQGHILIHYQAFREWVIKKQGQSERHLKMFLEQEGVKFEAGPNVKATLGKGTPVKTPQVRVVKIDMTSHPDLVAMLDESNARIQQPQLQLVK